MRVFIYLLVACGFFAGIFAHADTTTYSKAYFVAVKGGTGSFNSRVRTHIILAGRGAELGSMFQSAAAARATRLNQLYPKNQIVLIATQEGDYKENRARLQAWGFKVHRYVEAVLTPAYVEGELRNLQSVATVDIFAHTSAVYGAQMGGGDNRVTAQHEHLAFLRNRFVQGAYAVLHGCNSGYHMAPMFSKLWGIPVAGSFAATEFERLHENNNFYLYEQSFKPAGNWASTNSISFPQPIACENGACMRLRPDNFPYKGIWGDYKEGGLGIFKFFCPGIGRGECELTMSEALMSNLLAKKVDFRSSEADMQIAAREFLCPTGGKTQDAANACAERVQSAFASGDRTYTPFHGKSIQCDWKGCVWEWKCTPIKGSDELSCDILNTSPKNTTTFMDEYAAYMSGLKRLKSTGPRL